MFAGPFNNLVLAVLFFTIVLVGFGTPETTTTIARRPRLRDPRRRRRARPPRTPARCRSPRDGQLCDVGAAGCARPERSPAAKAGLRAGRHDRRDRRRAGDPRDRRRLGAGPGGDPRQRRHPGVAHRRARRGPARTSPSRRSRTPSTPSRRATRTISVGYVGVSPAQTYVRQSVTEVPGFLGRHDRRARSTGSSRSRRRSRRWPARRSWARSATRTARSAWSASAGSPARSSRFDDFTTTEKVSFFFQLLAGVNLVLFLFNLLPIYPLDGGHIAGALYEKARATVARLRGRPDPGPFDIARLMPVAYVVAGLFLGAVGAALHRRHRQPDHPGLSRAGARSRRVTGDVARRRGYWAAWRSPSASACRLHLLPSSLPVGRPASSTSVASASAATSRSACSR